MSVPKGGPDVAGKPRRDESGRGSSLKITGKMRRQEAGEVLAIPPGHTFQPLSLPRVRPPLIPSHWGPPPPPPQAVLKRTR